MESIDEDASKSFELACEETETTILFFVMWFSVLSLSINLRRTEGSAAHFVNEMGGRHCSRL
jgi:hypothetical protein